MPHFSTAPTIGSLSDRGLQAFGIEHLINVIVRYYRNLGLKVKAKRFGNVTESTSGCAQREEQAYHIVHERLAEVSGQPQERNSGSFPFCR